MQILHSTASAGEVSWLTVALRHERASLRGRLHMRGPGRASGRCPTPVSAPTGVDVETELVEDGILNEELTECRTANTSGLYADERFCVCAVTPNGSRERWALVHRSYRVFEVGQVLAWDRAGLVPEYT
jgi:hypothetical protein